MLLQLTAQHLCAGLVVQDGKVTTPADWWQPESWQNPAHRAMLAVHVARLTGARVAELTAAFEIYADQAWAQQTALRLGYTPDVPREMAPTR